MVSRNGSWGHCIIESLSIESLTQWLNTSMVLRLRPPTESRDRYYTEQQREQQQHSDGRQRRRESQAAPGHAVQTIHRPPGGNDHGQCPEPFRKHESWHPGAVEHHHEDRKSTRLN